MSDIESLRQELAEARRQQSAMAEALEAVALSSYDRDEMLRRLLRTAAGLCDADIAGISLVEDDELVGAITLSGDPADEAFMRGFRLPLSDPSSLNVQSLISGEILQNPDVYGSPLGDLRGRDHFKFKAILSVPMIRDGAGVGVFQLCRNRTGLFSEAEIALVRSFAAQAVIAITNAKHVEELERQRAEMAAALDREAVSAEVMRAINRSQIDLPSILDQLTRSAVRLSGMDMGGLFVREGDYMIPHVGARLDPDTADFLRANPIPIKAATILARAARTGESLEVEDFEEPIEKAYRDRFDYRALLHAPMMAEGDCIGVLAIARREPGPFAQRQKDIIRSFADQAAIALRNVRLFKDLEARTAELNEALEQQTATAETLQTLGRSAFDLDAVLNTLLGSAMALCDAASGNLVVLLDGDYRSRAIKGYPSENMEVLKAQTYKPGRENVVHRVLLSGSIEMIPDGERDPDFVYPGPTLNRSFLGVPLLRDGEIIGVFVLGRRQPGGFTERQIDLVKTFADQAVIAIGNVRLFKDLEARTAELNEALEQQTATAETLKTLSRSVFDLDSVLNTLLQSAMSLCDANAGGLVVREGGEFRARALCGHIPENAERIKRRVYKPGRQSVAPRVLLSGRVEMISDALLDPEFEYQGLRLMNRSFLGVPLLQDQEIIGVFVLNKRETGGFTERQIELVKTYADQAVIAIGNVRLFKDLEARTAELNEALEQQTATAETLQTLSRSAFDLDAVLNTLVQSAMSLCHANAGGLVVRDGGEFRMRALCGHIPENADRIKRRVYKPGRQSVATRVLLSGAVEMISDALLDPEFEYQGLRLMNRSFLGVPLLQDQQIIGVFVLNKRETGGFTERQIELVKTYADQAAIAIGNVRLFKDLEARTAELNEALEQQTATAETLQTLSRSAFDLDAVLGTLTQSAKALCGADTSGVVVRIGGEYRMRAASGMPPELEEILRQRVFAPGRESIIPRVLLSGRVEIVPDAEQDPEFIYADKRFPRSVLGVPLIRDGDILGSFMLGKYAPSGFTERQIELVKTFADQAVIAIGNVRLFQDLEARTAELHDALEQQTATAETLKTLSRSAFDLDAVLNTIIKSAVALCGAESGGLAILESGKYWMRANAGFDTVMQKLDKSAPIKLGRGRVISRALLSGKIEHVTDSLDDEELIRSLPPGVQMRYRTLLSVPLLQDSKIIGAILFRRKEPGGFTERQIDTVKTFADQAVIAIGNAQLFKDLGTRTEELRRSLEELRATQDRLIQTEKLASLGQLTAGVAHEIKNPLNFVNNFSKLSVELLEELGDALRSAALPANLKDEIADIAQTLTDNLEKIRHHGQRADSIVKNMLLHSRKDGGERRAVDLNALIEESLNLAYHGARAERRDFTIELLRDLDPKVGQVAVYPQEITRVLLNLFSNGFYAAVARAREPGFTPTLRVSSKACADQVEIRVRDNGAGIPEAIRDKLFTPFFTTKPAGEGTGLGLSLSHDIVVKQHGGSLSFESEAGLFTEFRITLPQGESMERAT